MPRNYQLVWTPPSSAPALVSGADGYVATQEGADIGSLSSGALNVPSGSIVFAWPAMGVLANLVAPTDSAGNAYTSLLPAHNYQGWAASGQHLYYSKGVVGSSGLVITESMASNRNDEVTMSVVAVRGNTVQAAVAETPSPGPVSTPTLTTSGPAVLLSSWWGDGAFCQVSASPSAGWTKLHELNKAVFVGGCIQTALAYRVVSGAGTFSCAWSADDGGAGTQGGVAYIVSVE